MPPPPCQCVFPDPTEQHLLCIEDPASDTAIRVYLQPGQEGYVRLQQMAHDGKLGWYVQKSVIIPGCMLRALLPQLAKADCLIPRRNEATISVPFMKLTSQSPDPAPQRRGA